MYFLQEAIAASPFLLIALIVAIITIVVVGYALYTWAKRKKDGTGESGRPAERVGPVAFIIVVVLMILMLAGCGWLCGIKYG